MDMTNNSALSMPNYTGVATVIVSRQRRTGMEYQGCSFVGIGEEIWAGNAHTGTEG